MKNPRFSLLLIFSISAALPTACNEAEQKPHVITTKEHMKAEKQNLKNMLSAYEGEITATAKYAAFSKRAEEDGYHNIALLYDAVSAAENIHARNHRAVLIDAGVTIPNLTPNYKVKTTKENLSDDIGGEAYEAQTMYPDFLKTAETAGNQIAHLSLTYAMNTEAKHKFFFEQALGNINSNTLNSLPAAYHVCPSCGNTYTTAPNHCDFCLTESEKFLKFL